MTKAPGKSASIGNAGGVANATPERPHLPTFAEALCVWARIGLLSFGGPTGQIAMMHRVLVEERRWIGEERFLHALSFCMVLPGPEAQQLAVYIGWLMNRTPGGLAAGVLFVLPGLVSIMALSWIYALYGNVGIIAAVFFGLKTAVLAIVADAVVRIGKRALRGRMALAVAAASFVAIFAFAVPFPIIVAAAGIIGYAAARLGLIKPGAGNGHRPQGALVIEDAETVLGAEIPEHARVDRSRSFRTTAILLVLWLAPTAVLVAILGPSNTFATIATFFSAMAVVTFGGAYAALAYVAQQAVSHYHWLAPGEMLNGLGLAETTPGPLIMVTQFVGFIAAFRHPGSLPPLVAGTLGGLLTTWVTFAPCFLWIFLGAPYVERLRNNATLSTALATITAAVVGVILNLAVWFALHVLFHETVPFQFHGLAIDVPVLASIDVAACALAVLALFAVFRLKAGVLQVLLGCAVAGLALHVAGLA